MFVVVGEMVIRCMNEEIPDSLFFIRFIIVKPLIKYIF